MTAFPAAAGWTATAQVLQVGETATVQTDWTTLERGQLLYATAGAGAWRGHLSW